MQLQGSTSGADIPVLPLTFSVILAKSLNVFVPLFLFFLNPQPRIYLLIFEREEGGERETSV